MPYLYSRQNPLDDARNTLSSWDNCMAKNYCKWPVIVGIIVGGLIALSVVVCIARCICCGAECAICCCKCCTCCCGSSGSRGHKRMKSEPTPTYPPYVAAGAPNPYAPNPYAQAHAAAPPPPIDTRPVNQQYRSHATPAFAPSTAPSHEPPQFATFASPSKPVNEDALPAMPSWGDARDRHIEVEEPPPPPQNKGDMELDRLNHNGSANSGSVTAMAAVGARKSPGPARSPISPMGDGYGYDQGFEKEPLVGTASQRRPHASPGPYGRPYAQQDDYRRGSPAQNLSPVYGAGAGYAQNQSYDRHSPIQRQPQSYNEYDQRDPYDHQDSYSQAQTLPPYRSPSPPAQNQYNYDNNNNASYDNFAAAPTQQRSHTPGYSQPAPAPAAYEHTQLSAEPVSAYPGQRSYTPQSAYPGQTSYQAFNPGQTSQQFSGVQRKGVDGSYRDI